jgi:hypothetical protein
MPIQFRGQVRQWREDKPRGIAVVDVPADLVAELGGRRQMRVTGTLQGAPFQGSTMLVAGGGFWSGRAAERGTSEKASATDVSGAAEPPSEGRARRRARPMFLRWREPSSPQGRRGLRR